MSIERSGTFSQLPCPISQGIPKVEATAGVFEIDRDRFTCSPGTAAKNRAKASRTLYNLSALAAVGAGLTP